MAYLRRDLNKNSLYDKSRLILSRINGPKIIPQWFAIVYHDLPILDDIVVETREVPTVPSRTSRTYQQTRNCIIPITVEMSGSICTNKLFLMRKGIRGERRKRERKREKETKGKLTLIQCLNDVIANELEKTLTS